METVSLCFFVILQKKQDVVNMCDVKRTVLCHPGGRNPQKVWHRIPIAVDFWGDA